MCVDCDVRGLLLTVNRMMMLDLVHLARPIPPKSSPEQIAADDAAAKVLRRKIRVVK